MSEILMDRSETRLINAIEENLFAWLPVCARLEGARLGDTPGVRRSITNAPVSLFNSIMDARLTPENVEATIDLIQADAATRKIPIQWWVGPSTRPQDLVGRLLSHGFEPDDGGPGMAVELDRLNESLPYPMELSILPADDKPSIRAWCRALLEGFEIPEAKFEIVNTYWGDLLSRVDRAIMVPFVAWLDEKPVATSLLLLGAGVAGIYAVATIPEARRKGIGARVTLHPLKVARSRGYKVGILQASEMGLPVYRTLGFQEYCMITSYTWRSKTD